MTSPHAAAPRSVAANFIVGAVATGDHSQIFMYPPGGVRSLRDWFVDWSEATDPALPAELLLAGRADVATELRRFLSGPCGVRVVTAGSREEAVAFTAAVLLGPHGDGEAGLGDGVTQPNLEALLERAVVVLTRDAWGRCVADERPSILVAMYDTEDVHRAVKAGHHVVVPTAARPEDVGRRGDLVLPRLHPHQARDVLVAAGVPFWQAVELAGAARSSIGAMRRRIARQGPLRRPAWSTGESGKVLVSLLLAGAFRGDFAGDRTVLRSLTGREWRNLEADLVEVAAHEDSPIRRQGSSWVLLDIVDAWEAVGHLLTTTALDEFRSRAVEVLGQRDLRLDRVPLPAPSNVDVELTVHERDALQREAVAAELARMDEAADGSPPGPTPGFSDDLRQGMTETLRLLGAHGGATTLVDGSTGQEVADQIVGRLLRGADRDRWLSLADLLPGLAEASPMVFLDRIAEELQQPGAPVMVLFQEQPAGVGSGSLSRHGGLLRALETLAWWDRILPRVTRVLAEMDARLDRRDPEGRFTNRPRASLEAILNVWTPQGPVGARTHLAVLDQIRREEPDVGWDLTVGLVRGANRGLVLHPGPRFRDWTRTNGATRPKDLVGVLNGLATRITEDACDDGARWVTALGLVDQLPRDGRRTLLQQAEPRWDAVEANQRGTVIRSLRSSTALTKCGLSLVVFFVGGEGSVCGEYGDGGPFGFFVAPVE
ncbi:MAG: hypothetical protein HYR62_03810 [Actinobacteria bacterium]|nr:hypothetical protein [Actinomycetota bacterium]